MARSPAKDGSKLNQGLRALVTAGAGGIGKAIAQAMARAGARVHICDVSEEALRVFRRRNAAISATQADVAVDEDVDRLFEDVRAKLRGLDVLVNNAGIAGPTAPVEAMSPADWRRTIEVNLVGQFLCTRAAVPLLRKSRNASIVNLSSVAGRLGYAYRTPYAASKWGVIGLTQSLAKELGPAGIRVNAILPGLVEGARIEQVIAARAKALRTSYEQVEKEYLEKVSLRRMVSPEDIADTVVFLCSPLGRNISGQSIGVCGNVEAI